MLSLKRSEQAREAFEKGSTLIAELFGPLHGLNQRALYFKLYLSSINEETIQLRTLAERNLKLVQQVNGLESSFTLDALLTKVSVLTDVEAPDEEIVGVISEMEAISSANSHTT